MKLNTVMPRRMITLLKPMPQMQRYHQRPLIFMGLAAVQNQKYCQHTALKLDDAGGIVHLQSNRIVLNLIVKYVTSSTSPTTADSRCVMVTGASGRPTAN